MKKLEVNLELLQNVLKRGTAFAIAGSIVLGSHTAIIKDNNLGIQTVCAAEEQSVVNLNVQTGVNLYMNDKGFVPKDVNGNETYPFICDGTTYVPIRAIAELFNATVNWDEKTRTVVIATTGESAKLSHTHRSKQELINKTITAEKGVRLVINGKECIPKDVNGNVKDIYIVNGTTYVPVRAVSEALDLPIAWSEKSNSVFIGNHKTIGLTVENINDPEVFRNEVENFMRVMKPGSWTYRYNEIPYDIIANDLEEFAVIIAMMNLDYCTDELLTTVFPNLTDYDINRIVYLSGLMAFMFIDYPNHFDYTHCAVDMEEGKFLDDLQNMCTEESLEQNTTDLGNLFYNYLIVENEIYDQYRKNPFINLTVALVSTHKQVIGRTQYYDEIVDFHNINKAYKKYNTSVSNYYREQMSKKMIERYHKALENTNQKQLKK